MIYQLAEVVNRS